MPDTEDRRGEFEQRVRTGLLVALEGGIDKLDHLPSNMLADIVDQAVIFIMELTHDEKDDSNEVLALKLRLSEAQRHQAEGIARVQGDRLRRIKAAFDEAFG